MEFYEQRPRRSGDFEAGIRTALQAILASPHFLFRLEEAPATVRPGQNYRISDSTSRRGCRSSSGARARTRS